MASALHTETPGGELLRLRAQISRMQRRRADAKTLPVHPALSGLFPGAELQAGAAYTVSASTSLLLALAAAPSRAGSWCALIGFPEIGAEAAAGCGIALERLVLVPDPGERWLSAAAAIAEVFPIVAVRPPERPRDTDAARLAARLRDRGGVLLVDGPWPAPEAALTTQDAVWSGLGDGHGLLSSREVTVIAAGRRIPVPRRIRVRLPGPDGTPEAIGTTVGGTLRPASSAAPGGFERRLEAVAG